MFKILSNIFRGAKVTPADLSLLNADMHSHLIPGIDDGAKNMDESLMLLRELNALGYKKFITTPHVFSDHYKNTPAIIADGLKQIRMAAIRENIPVEIHAAAEYYIDSDFIGKIERKELLTFGKNYVLVEISFLNAPENFDAVITKLLHAGYIPVLAHAERYPHWFRLDRYRKLKDRGVLMQININSITGYYSAVSKKIAQILIDENMVDLAGTDCHSMNEIEALKKCRTEKYLCKLIDSGKLQNIRL